jgi:hypothetical protein
MISPESPTLPRSPGFYIFRSHSSIPPPEPPLPQPSSLFHEILPSITRQLIRSITSVLLPIILLPFHFFFLLLSIMTTILAAVVLSWRAFMVYLDIGMSTTSQVYSDYTIGRRRVDKRRRDLLRKIVLEREKAIRAENERPKTRERRGLTIT